MSAVYTLGIDVGSTASKCIILKDGKEIVAKSLSDVGAGTSGPQRAIDAVLEAAGVRDIVAKSLGSSNHANVVKATLQALASLRTSDQVLADRGKKKEKAI